MTYLVTGAAGFIGSHLVERLLLMGHKVVGLDNMSTGQQSNVSRLSIKYGADKERFNLYQCDIRDRHNLHQLFSRHPDVHMVFHQAALGSIPRSIASPQETFDNNVVGFNNILSLCASREFRVKRLVYASSSSVYGGVADTVKNEVLPTCPLNPYAASKLMNETQAIAYGKAFGLETIGLRYFNVFGPYQNPTGEYAAVIAKWVQAIKVGEPIILQGDGKQKRDFTYVDNVVDANIAASLALDSAIGRVFNVGCGVSVSLNDVRAQLLTHSQKIVRWENHKPRANDIQDSVSCLERSRRFLGYVPQINWREGIKKTCDWALSVTA